MAEHHSVAAVFSPCTLTPSRRMTPAPKAGEQEEARRAQRHQRVGAQARHLLVPLPLEADGATEQQGEAQSQGGVAQARQVQMHGLSYSVRCCKMMTVARQAAVSSDCRD